MYIVVYLILTYKVPLILTIASIVQFCIVVGKNSLGLADSTYEACDYNTRDDDDNQQ